MRDALKGRQVAAVAEFKDPDLASTHPHIPPWISWLPGDCSQVLGMPALFRF